MEDVYSKILKVTCVGVLFFISVAAVDFSEENEGHALGLLPHCPGSENPAEINPERLHKLRILLLGSGSLFTANWTSYTYYNVKQLAKHPEMDFNRRTIVYCPGYMDSILVPSGRWLGSIYRQLGYNVLIVEYVEFTANVFPITVRIMRPLGKHVAEMLAKLTSVGLDPKKLELLGISLGGVSMGFIAQSFREITGHNISTITALDPTGPCVRHRSPEHRLDPSDADFILHIVTNSAGYGIGIPVGHVSVYVNGGEYQPGYVPSFVCDDICSHLFTFWIWISALQNPGKFIAVQCDSVQQAKDHNCFDRQPMVTNTMDWITDRSKPGIYYLATSNRYPYYLGKKGLRKRRGTVGHISSLNAVDVLRMK